MKRAPKIKPAPPPKPPEPLSRIDEHGNTLVPISLWAEYKQANAVLSASVSWPAHEPRPIAEVTINGRHDA